MGSAGAGHVFTKIGIESGEQCTFAGPELPVKQMKIWLLLWLDGRRAAANQLADQDDWGDPLPRPSLEEVDDVCKTYKSTAGLGPSHQEVIAQLVSRSLRYACSFVCAGRWRKSGRTITTRPISGAARARRAIALVMVAAPKGASSSSFVVVGLGQIQRPRRSRSLLGGGRHDKFPKATAGQLARFLRRLAVPRSRQVCYLSLSGPSGPFSQAAVAPPRQPD